MNLPVSIYIHWPFCKSKCPYCDFNSHVREGIDELVWRDALLTELDYYSEIIRDRKIESIFFGGGTPSLMQPETVAAIVNKVSDKSSEPEITLEANPTSSEAAKFEKFRQAGINRLSMGIQSLNNKTLKFLGREHSAEEALAAFAAAREIFPRTSFDLIYANPGQTIDEWSKELGGAIGYGSGHMSLYQLTIEPGTAFNIMHKNGRLVLPTEELAEDFYNVTQEIMSVAGYNAYEVSNHAKPGHECRHNLSYWRSRDFIGIGAGAHGRFSLGGERLATMNIKSPERWLASVQKNGHGAEEKTSLTIQEQGEEILLMGLRLSEGVNIEFFNRRGGVDLLSAVAIWQAEGLLEIDSGYLRATSRGRLLLNRLVSEIVNVL